MPIYLFILMSVEAVDIFHELIHAVALFFFFLDTPARSAPLRYATLRPSPKLK